MTLEKVGTKIQLGTGTPVSRRRKSRERIFSRSATLRREEGRQVHLWSRLVHFSRPLAEACKIPRVVQVGHKEHRCGQSARSRVSRAKCKVGSLAAATT